MPKQPRNTIPTSVILTNAQKAFLQAFAAKEDRTFSSLLRHIISSWCAFQMNKKDSTKTESSGE